MEQRLANQKDRTRKKGDVKPDDQIPPHPLASDKARPPRD
jgi:hypothetical protein